MSRRESKIRNFIKRSTVICAAAVLIGSVIPVQAAAREYDVIFRAGSNGTIGGAASITEKVMAGTPMSSVNQPDAGDINANDGYYFTGYSPAIDQNAAVTKRQVYVAQYARITNAGEYRVNYVDDKGVALATEKIVRTQIGITVTEDAAEIDGFTPETATQTVTVSKEAAEITFRYVSAADAPVINIVDNQTQEVTNNVADTTQAGNTAATAQTPAATNQENNADTAQENQTAATQPNDETTTIDGQEVPKDQNPAENATIDDQEVPKGNTQLKSQADGIGMYIGFGIAGVAIVAGAIFVMLKKKRS